MPRIRSIKPEAAKSKTLASWPREVRYAWFLLSMYLDDKRPCDVWADRNMVMLERLAQRVNALADGAFA